MNASGFLIPPYVVRTEAQIALWDATFDRIQPFLPDLKAELFPPPKVPVPFEVPLPPTPISEPVKLFEQPVIDVVAEVKEEEEKQTEVDGGAESLL